MWTFYRRVIRLPLLLWRARSAKSWWNLTTATTPSQSPLHSRHQQAPSSSLAVTAQKTLASLVKTWNSWNHAKEGSLKKRTYTFGQKLLDRVPIEETFLVHIPSLRGHHPESLGKVSMRKHCLWLSLYPIWTYHGLQICWRGKSFKTHVLISHQVQVSVLADLPLDVARQTLQDLVTIASKKHERNFLGAVALLPLTLSFVSAGILDDIVTALILHWCSL